MIDFVKEEGEARLGWFSQYDMECIYPVLKDSKKSDVYLEIGVDRGRSLEFARKYFKGDVFGIDIKTIKERGGKGLVKGTNFIHKPSTEAAKIWTLPINVLFIDADHSYEACLADWENYSPFVVDGGWVFFHDMDETSPGVVKVFQEIDGKKWKKSKSTNQRCSMAWVEKK